FRFLFCCHLSPFSACESSQLLFQIFQKILSGSGFQDIACRLQADGAREIAIPCVTAQFYQKKLQEKVSIPVMNGVEEMADYLKDTGCDSVGILATDGTVQSNLFGSIFDGYGIKYYYPDKADQKKVMSIIYDQVKAGKKPDVDALIRIADRLVAKGAKRVILGCTELSVIKDGYVFPDYMIDVLDVMARNCVKHFASLRSEYELL
ncbi:MAG: aspartate/glutamate racemase family protein, partial [Lachnospiraceae bacterium]|nr:aspartate/glutamate racemase family protein [Lachnospiraceae bacterium]